jgi:glutathione S-transferase
MYLLTAVVTLLSLVLYWVLGALVGRARGVYKISAPACTGNADFERRFRVHQNTMESLVMHLPAMWLFAAYVSDRYAALLGVAWLVGRIIYAQRYYRDAALRGPGVLISIGATTVLLLGALAGAVMALLR